MCRLKQYHFLAGDDNPLRSQCAAFEVSKKHVDEFSGCRIISLASMAYEAMCRNCLCAEFYTSPYQPGWGKEHWCINLTYIQTVKHWLRQHADKWFWECGHWAWPMDKSINKDYQLQGWARVIYLREKPLCFELVQVGEEKSSTTVRKATE